MSFEEAKPGWPDLGCLGCGEKGDLRITLDGKTIECNSCEKEWDVADLEALLLSWVPFFQRMKVLMKQE